MNANTLKDNLLKALDEAIDANKDQLSGVGADDLASYKYMLGIGHTLQDMKSRVKDEYQKLYKQRGKIQKFSQGTIMVPLSYCSVIKSSRYD